MIIFQEEWGDIYLKGYAIIPIIYPFTSGLLYGHCDNYGRGEILKKNGKIRQTNLPRRWLRHKKQNIWNRWKYFGESVSSIVCLWRDWTLNASIVARKKFHDDVMTWKRFRKRFPITGHFIYLFFFFFGGGGGDWVGGNIRDRLIPLTKGPVMQRFDTFFVTSPNMLLKKLSSFRPFETSWRICDCTGMKRVIKHSP